MALYPYTGTLADLGGAPFPGATPDLYVVADQDTFGPEGPIPARKQVEIEVASNGSFTVQLTASIDTTPPVKYRLICDWLTATGKPLGSAEWDFTAQPGGGPIATMPGVMTRVWYSTKQPPVNRSGIYWVHPSTGDVKEWV